MLKTNKKLVWVLGLLLAGVWGTIGYQLVDAVAANDKVDSNTGVDFSVGKEQGMHESYKDDIKDPFEYYKPAKKNTAKKIATISLPPIYVPPPFRLTGIVLDETRKTAVLEGNDGSVSFLSEGDSLGGVRILAIDGKRVTFLYMNQKKMWSLGD